MRGMNIGSVSPVTGVCDAGFAWQKVGGLKVLIQVKTEIFV